MTQVFVVTQRSSGEMAVLSSEQNAIYYMNTRVRSICQTSPAPVAETIGICVTPADARLYDRISKLPLEEMATAWNSYFENSDPSRCFRYEFHTVDPHVAKGPGKKRIESVHDAKQHLFDVVVKGLARQKWERSVDAEGYCVWSSPGNKRRDPAGWLIPLDEHDSPEAPMDNVAVVQQCSTLRDFLSNQPGSAHEELGEFMRQMQYAHDDYPNPDGMHRRFVGLCVEYKLEAPPGLEEAPE